MRNNYDINEDSFTSENYTPFFTNNSQFEDNIFNPLNLSPFPLCHSIIKILSMNNKA